MDEIELGFDFDVGFNGELAEYRWEKIRPYLPENVNDRHVLDIGAGSGSFTKRLRQHFKWITAIEPDEERCERLMSSEAPISIYRDYFENIEFRLKFNSIFMIGVLEHMDNPVANLKKARELLAYGGSLYITVPNAESFHRRHGYSKGIIKDLEELGDLDRRVGHKRYYALKTLCHDILSAGFDIEDVIYHGIMFKPYPNSEMEKLDPETLSRFSEIPGVGYRSRDGAEILAICKKTSSGY